MGTNCTSPVGDLFLFCSESDFMLSLSDNNRSILSEKGAKDQELIQSSTTPDT